jgi:(2R)-ethylmalonyl-CoA mutase
VQQALQELSRVAADERGQENLMVPTIAAARAGATTGEWAATLRGVFGSYRAPTGVAEAAAAPVRESAQAAASESSPGVAAPGKEGATAVGNGNASPRSAARELRELREQVSHLEETLGRRPKILVGKPGLDGHSNGAEQIAVMARDCGLEVVYQGIRLTPEQIAASALQEGVHVIGLSILSGSHRELIPAVIGALHRAGVRVPVVVGGIIPECDVPALKRAGVAAVYTPKDFDITRVMQEVVGLVAEAANGGRRAAGPERRDAEQTVLEAPGAESAGVGNGRDGALPAERPASHA